MFQAVDGEGFRNALAQAQKSPLFDRVLLGFISMDDMIDEEAAIHEGHLKISGSLVAPALCTLIIGDLEVSEFVDLRRASSSDERGLLIVLGALRCRDFISDYGCCTIVDGDLLASQSVLHGFSDSTLAVTGILKTRLFVGADIWAEVGAGAEMEYGVGYCLPIDYSNAAEQAILPQRSEDETAEAVRVEANEDGYALTAEPFAELLRAGKPLFR